MKQLTVTVLVLCLLTGSGLLLTADAASQSEENADIEMSNISGDIKKAAAPFSATQPGRPQTQGGDRDLQYYR